MSWWAHTFLPDREALRLRSKDEETESLPATEAELRAWREAQAARQGLLHFAIEQMLADPKDRAEFELWLDEKDRDVPDPVEPDNCNDNKEL